MNVDNWDYFRLDLFNMKERVQNPSMTLDENQQQQQQPLPAAITPYTQQKERIVTNLLKEGDIKGAMKRAVSDTGGVNIPREQVIQKLLDKMPDETEAHTEFLPTDQLQDAFEKAVQRCRAINNGTAEVSEDDSQSEEPEDITPEEIAIIVRKGRKTAAPGPDKLSYKHLSMLIPRTCQQQPSKLQEEFLDKFAKVLTIMYKGREPEA
jgi:hypothetical protein